MPLKKYTANFGNSELTHLLKRTMFGTQIKDIKGFNGKSLTQVLSVLLQDKPISLPPINAYNDASYTDPTIALNQTWVNAPYGDGTVNSKRIGSFRGWWMGLLLNQETNIQEKMVLFWHNHFSLETDIVSDARYMYKYVALLQKYALGNFKSLVKEITLDPAMLKYLNGYLNTKTAPDENYGRELQELFTMGKGANSKYTEQDVKAAAKVLTGYRINSTKIESYFDTTKHDISNKQFSSFYKDTIIVGKSGIDGAKELDEMLDMIFLENELALFICRKIYRFFVYYDISDATEQEVIIPLAEIFRASNFEIKSVLLELLGSEHFFSTANRACYIKTPLDLIVGLYRDFNVALPDTTNITTQYLVWQYIKSQSASLQLDLGDPPNVAGWPAFYQEPQFYELWINSDTLPKRNQFSDLMIGNGYTRNTIKIVIDPIAYVSNFANPEDPNILINNVLGHLLVIETSNNLKKQLKNILLSNQVDDHYWTDAWTAYQISPTDKTKKSMVTTRLQAMLKYIMNLAEFQLI
jgi:uncharacterized protein (DUF1800 family)